MATKTEVLVATETGAVEHVKTGEVFVYRKGQTHIRGDHWALKQLPEGSFEPMLDAVRPAVEETTAEPGKKRGEA